ncbi:hypothetical protein [Oceanithermus sp.]|uniref:hypothetical protein n=1 Tax=Oceanithermus sp. TaxID=2268145 RepID=UPI0025FD1ADA|nr:hypothetical protein [Oceanithermus sp.]
MKKWLAIFLAFGLAFAAESVSSGETWEISGDGDSSVAVTETIVVKIPVRYALHLTQTKWVLDLSDPPEAPSDYTFNGDVQNPNAPASGCYLVPKSVTSGQELASYLQDGGMLKPIGTYPAIADFDEDGKISDNEKGTLICVNHKTLQKFSNDPDGWQLKVSVSGNKDSGFGYFGMADHILPAGGWGFFYTNALPVSDQVVASGSGTTGGWLDDDIVEAFWFDGTEAAGDYTLTVTFTLAGL